MFYFSFFFINLFTLYLFHYDLPKISIIVPIYNVNLYLKECLDSLKNQTLKNIEIICVNDGSTDNSFEIIMKYMNDNRFLILDKKNTGYGDSMNNGFDFASGKFIGIVEPDDFVDFNMFNFLYKKTLFVDIDIVRSNFIVYWEKNIKKVNRFNELNKLYNKILRPTDFPNIFLIAPSIWSGIYNKDFLIKNNIKFLPTPGASYQDTSFFLKTLFKSKNVLFINESFYYYRQTNINSSVKNTSLNKAILINKEFYEIDNYYKKDLKLFYQIEKYYNTKKIKTLIWNLNRIKNKEYFKIFYKDICNILIKGNYLQYKFNNYELRLFNYSINYGEEIASDIFFNTINYNITYPKISIIIPFYNSENFIKESLNSLIYQTFKNFEIICVNDGSTDNSIEILREFQKKDKRIHIISQKNIINSKNIGIKESKGDYLLFLNFVDIFNYTMLEELYSKIKGNDLEIIICNSQLFKIKNKRYIFYNNNYYFSDNLIKNYSFLVQNIKQYFLNLFIWWPWDKLFKKHYIENIQNEFHILNNTNYLSFIYFSIISSKKIYFFDKILINHRIGINTSLEYLNEKSCDNLYKTFIDLKIFLKKINLYKKFKRDFINYIASFLIWKLENIHEKLFCYFYQKLRNEWLNEFNINKYNKKFFYNINDYKKIKYILKTELKKNENKNKFKINEEETVYLKKKNIHNKIIIPFYKINNNYKFKILKFIYLNLKI